MAFGHIAGRPLRSGTTKQSVTADEVSEGAGDAIESWLFDAYAKVGEGAGSGDLASVALRVMARTAFSTGLTTSGIKASGRDDDLRSTAMT
jgi:hypothetical protein